MKFNIPRPRIANQQATPVNRTPGIGMRGPGTRVVAAAPIEEDKPSAVRRGFNDWKPKS